MKISAFAVDEKLEVGGFWKDLGGGSSVRIARAGNRAYNKKLRELMKPYRGPMGLLEMSDETAHRVFVEAMAGTVLVDWKGLSDEDGKDVPYSEKKAIEWMLKYKEFYKIIDALSNDIANFQSNIEEVTKDNIKK